MGKSHIAGTSRRDASHRFKRGSYQIGAAALASGISMISGARGGYSGEKARLETGIRESMAGWGRSEIPREFDMTEYESRRRIPEEGDYLEQLSGIMG